MIAYQQLESRLNAFNKHRVLVAEDDSDALHLLTYALQKDGYLVTGSTDGESALAALKSQPFDVILSDINMPRMNGLELLRRAHEHDQDIPVVLITGQPNMSSAAQAVEHGALHYLFKPLDLYSIRQAVSQAVIVHRDAVEKRNELARMSRQQQELRDRDHLKAEFESALPNIKLVMDPITSHVNGEIYAYAVSVDSSGTDSLDADRLQLLARSLGRQHELGNALRAQVIRLLDQNQLAAPVLFKISASDLYDPGLFASGSEWVLHCDKIILALTHLKPFDSDPTLLDRIQQLKTIGFRIALDDFSNWNTHLSLFNRMDPDLFRLDPEFVLDIHSSPTRLKTARFLLQAARASGVEIVARGVEATADLEALTDAGFHLFQGKLSGVTVTDAWQLFAAH